MSQGRSSAINKVPRIPLVGFVGCESEFVPIKVGQSRSGQMGFLDPNPALNRESVWTYVEASVFVDHLEEKGLR